MSKEQAILDNRKRIAELEAERDAWKMQANSDRKTFLEYSERVAELQRLHDEMQVTFKRGCETFDGLTAENARLREALEKSACHGCLTGSSDCICGLRAEALATRQEAAQMVADPSVPPTEVHLRQDGKTVGKIVNIEPTVQDRLPEEVFNQVKSELDAMPMFDRESVQEEHQWQQGVSHCLKCGQSVWSEGVCKPNATRYFRAYPLAGQPGVSGTYRLVCDGGTEVCLLVDGKKVWVPKSVCTEVTEEE